jgi:hypothetical protein
VALTRNPMILQRGSCATSGMRPSASGTSALCKSIDLQSICTVRMFHQVGDLRHIGDLVSHPNSHLASSVLPFHCALCRPRWTHPSAAWAQRRNLISRTLGLHSIWLRSNTRTTSSVRSAIASGACRILPPMRLTPTMMVHAPTATAHGPQRLSLPPLNHLAHKGG